MSRSVLLLLILALAPAALAADDVLQLRTGRLAVGTVTASDERGVILRTDAGDARFDWESLTPLCEYEIRSDRLAAADANGRVALAELCIRSGLYPYARKEIATARSLGFEDGERLNALELAGNQAEAEEAFARVDQRMLEEDYAAALDEVRRFLIQAPKSDYTEKARVIANDLLRRIDNQKLLEEEAAKAAEDDVKREGISKRIDELLAKVREYRAAATAAWGEALRYHEIGNVTKARKGYQGAEKNLIAAFQTLRELQRVARRGVTYDKAEDEKDAIKTKLVEVYLGLATLYVADRNYKSGTEYVNKVLYLDPVNREALALRREIDEHRLVRSARKLTNTPGVRTTGPGGVTGGAK